MIELKGKRNSALIFADRIDKETKAHLATLLREKALADSKIRIMPDTHASKNGIIGMTLTLHGRILPSLLGMDIGCGMEAVNLGKVELDLPRLDQLIHERIPCGSKIHTVPQTAVDVPPIHELCCAQAIDTKRALLSLGTLGGGNHFIEIDKAETGELWLIIHSGSRQLGSDVATAYKEIAYRSQCKKARKSVRRTSVDEHEANAYPTKAQRREQRSTLPISRENAVLEGCLYTQYLQDVAIVSAFADRNRRLMAEIICAGMKITPTDRFSCVHNTVDIKSGLLRKGAISATLGERVIIPLNMRDGSILGVGLGNPDWNFSAPHGAGRACSRENARHAYSVEEFQQQMGGIYTTTAQAGSLDECPMAYKAPNRILPFLEQTVRVIDTVKPIYNFKAC